MINSEKPLTRAQMSAATAVMNFAARLGKVVSPLTTVKFSRAGFHFFPKLVADPDDPDHDLKFVEYFSRTSIDHWDLRKGLNDLHTIDMIPEPEVISAALRACRRVNDYALAIRFLEAIQVKCGKRKSKIWPYIVQEIRPTLNELGVDTPEELGYDKPELHLKSVYDD